MNLSRVACVIPTYQGKNDLARLLQSLKIQTSIFEIIVIDSSSTDGTLEIAKEYADTVISIPKSDFNHGGTRQLVVDQYPQFDIYIYMTQDAYLVDINSITKLLSFFGDPDLGAVCGRQLPHVNASPLAQHARTFNYPIDVLIKSNLDIKNLGIKTVFMSNSFAAYRRTALMEVGGFPSHVIFAEDMYVAAQLILKDWNIGYVGIAECFHSHDYSILEEFRRYFDMGVFHGREPWIRLNYGGAGGEGLRFVKSELNFLGFNRIYLWPVSLFRNLLKLLAYKLGQNEDKLPLKLKRMFSFYRGFWDGQFAKLK